MNVVDSSGWIEYFTEGPNSSFFANSIERVDELIVPAVCLYEVFKWVARERGETQALKAIAHMQLGDVADLDSTLAIFAAGFLIRPFGALVFGRLGDMIGRKYTFLLTLVLMGGSTF